MDELNDINNAWAPLAKMQPKLFVLFKPNAIAVLLAAIQTISLANWTFRIFSNYINRGGHGIYYVPI